MYLNVETYNSLGFKPEDLYYLISIKQVDKSVLEIIPEDVFERFKSTGLITSIKGTKKENPLHKLRLSKKGKDIFSSLEEAPIEEEDLKIFDWLSKHYLKLDKTIGNGARTKRHIRDFRISSGIEKNNLIILCLDFLKDEENMHYNNVLEYAFYKAPTAFQVRFNLEDSRLYKHYLKHKDRIDKKFEHKIN